MRLRLILSCCLLSGPLPGRCVAAEPQWKLPWKSASELLDLLRAVPEGRALVQAAEKVDPRFAEAVSAGASSLLERHTTERIRPLEERAGPLRSYRIRLRAGLPLDEALSELAHELVHFTRRQEFDPYASDFSEERYVRRRIEESGGELDAFLTECAVDAALSREFPAFREPPLCLRYRHGSQAREQARKDFWAVGALHRKFPESLRAPGSPLTEHPPVFRSSLNQQPYPWLYLQEFRSLRKSACEMNRASYRLSVDRFNARREPATGDARERIRVLESFHERHCRAD